MIGYKNVDLEYVPIVDLGTLSKTYDTLQKGHEQSIQAASELKSAIAKYDLNEAEDEWRAQKIRDIQQIVEDNSLEENAYSAYDDLIKAAGDIESDPGLIGRLRAQQDYKAYVDKVNNTDIPQEYKDAYIEHNPYKYVPKYDEKGNEIGGEKWQAEYNPTKMLNVVDVVEKAKKLIAEETGQYSNIKFVDGKGNTITEGSSLDDVNAAFYNTITNKWERLPKEKIMNSIKDVIKNDPQLHDSIRQEMLIDKWALDKANTEIKNNHKGDKTPPPAINRLTDAQGNILTEDEYINKLFTGFAERAAYNRNFSSGSFTQIRQAKAKAESKRGSGTKNDVSGLLGNEGTQGGKNYAIENTYGVDLNNIVVDSKNKFKALANSVKVNPEKLFNPDGKLNDAVVQEVISKITNPYERYKARLLYDDYNDASNSLEEFETSIIKDKDKYNSALRIVSGGDWINSDNGGGEFDNTLISYGNTLKELGVTKINITMNPNAKNTFLDILNQGTYSGYKRFVEIDENTGKIVIDVTNPNILNGLPMIASALKKGDDYANSGFWNTITQNFVDAGDDYRGFKAEFLDKDSNKINVSMSTMGGYSSATPTDVVAKTFLNGMGNVYDKANEFITKTNKTVNTMPAQLIQQPTVYEYSSLEHKQLMDAYYNGLIEETEFNVRLRNLRERELDNLKGTNWDNVTAYKWSNGNATGSRITNSTEKSYMANNIAAAVTGKNENNFSITTRLATSNVIKDKDGLPMIGLVVNIKDIKGWSTLVGEDGKKVSEVEYFIDAPNNKAIVQEFKNSRSGATKSWLQTVAANNDEVNLSTVTTNGTDNFTVQGSGDDFVLKKGNKPIKLLNVQEATDIALHFNTLKDIKLAIISGTVNDANKSKVRDIIEATCNEISNAVNIPADTIINNFYKSF